MSQRFIWLIFAAECALIVALLCQAKINHQLIKLTRLLEKRIEMLEKRK